MKDKQNKRFSTQTHFIGVLVPEDLTDKLEDCRTYMNQKFGCKSGHRTPIHITLVPPFDAGDVSTEELVLALEDSIKNMKNEKKLPFNVNVTGFDSFGERTIFAHVEKSDNWTNLRDNLISNIKSKFPSLPLKKDNKPFQPHLSVANRDIPSGCAIIALNYFANLNLKSNFSLDNVTLFVNESNKWECSEETVLKFE